MNVRLKFKNPVIGDGDLGTHIVLSTPLHVEEEKDVTSQDEYGQPITSRDIVVVPKSTFLVEKVRIISVLADWHNKVEINRLIEGGIFEFVDATEAHVLNSIPDPAKQVNLKK